MRTYDDLKILQALPLDVKILKTQQRIREAVDFAGGWDRISINWSGGKDSTVLRHIAMQMNPNVESAFVDTGLEYPENRRLILDAKDKGENVVILRPEMSFIDVIKKYGYPMISKDVSMTIYYAKRGSKWSLDRLNGRNKNGSANRYRESLYHKYKLLLDCGIEIGNGCCRINKERPLDKYHNFSGKMPLIATMASESLRRKDAWIKTGCNVFYGKKPISKPISFWTEQDVLIYSKENNVELSKVYGDIVPVHDQSSLFGDKLKTTGVDRTGCMFCGFGCHLEKSPTRFEKMKKTHPKHYEYCINGGEYGDDGIWRPNKDGLGLGHVFDELNGIYGDDFVKY